jgi:hypothetical protein
MRAALALVAAALAGCGGVTLSAADASVPGAIDDAAGEDGSAAFATQVVSFRPGAGASFGHAAMPGVVLGPPQGAGDLRGGTDVVSLGRGGEIVLGFDHEIVDGPGADFVVFENAFMVPGVEERYWEELGEVSVSDDGETWTTFPCDPLGARPHLGCAGWNPVYANRENGLSPLDPRVAGGDPFDLAMVGVHSARFLRIRDLSTQGLMPPATGFDLDAVGVIHAR